MSLAERLKAGRARLQHTTTRVRREDGRVLEEDFSPASGGYSARPLLSGEEGAGAGYVVDPEPDLQVGLVRPHLAVGSQDAAADRELLRRLGVARVLNVATGVPCHFAGEGDGPKYMAVELLDVPGEDLTGRFPEMFDFIGGAGGGVTLVHCNAGVSRAAAVAAGYLMWAEGLWADEAVAAVREARPAARPNPGFLEQLRGYGRTLEAARRADT